MSTLVCTVELSKTAGITVKVQNADGKITQTVSMDGTVLTLTVAGENDTSTVTQKKDSLVLECKGSSASSTITQNETSITTECKGSSATSTMAQKADSVTFTCKTFKVDAETLELLASKGATLSAGTDLSLKASAGATLAATQKLSLSGTQGTTLSGGTVDVSADQTVSVEASAEATFKGSITNVMGNVVNLG